VFTPQRQEIIGPVDCIQLTATESRILHLLAAHEGHTLSPEQIGGRVWSERGGVQPGVIKTHIAHLRKKLSRMPALACSLQTVPGAGYRLDRVEPRP
jgi:DNA-binding response OmpR family regulator